MFPVTSTKRELPKDIDVTSLPRVQCYVGTDFEYVRLSPTGNDFPVYMCERTNTLWIDHDGKPTLLVWG